MMRRSLGALMVSFSLAAWLGFGPPAIAQTQPPEAEGCPRLISSAPPLIHRASVAADHLALTFVGHATFFLETPAGLKVATDYNDYVRPAEPPDVITMNRAHSTHFTDHPPAGITHVLRGWDPAGGAANHDVTIRDMRIRNVVTNIRNWAGGGTDYRGNSIFVFEASHLCVAHLGHLHHELEPEHLKQLGRIDVVLAPVDGSLTLDTDAMFRVIKSLDPPIVVPMHFFGRGRLDAFLERARELGYETRASPTPTLLLSRPMLPKKSTVIVLPGH